LRREEKSPRGTIPLRRKKGGEKKGGRRGFYDKRRFARNNPREKRREPKDVPIQTAAVPKRRGKKRGVGKKPRLTPRILSAEMGGPEEAKADSFSLLHDAERGERGKGEERTISVPLTMERERRKKMRRHLAESAALISLLRSAAERRRKGGRKGGRRLGRGKTSRIESSISSF